MVVRIGQRRRVHLYVTEHREAKHLTLDQVANRIGVALNTVWRWENEQHRLDPGKIEKLAEAIGVEPEAFWRPPSEESTKPKRPSLDELTEDLPDDVFEATYDFVKRTSGARK